MSNNITIAPNIGNLAIRKVPVNIIIQNGYQIKCKVVAFDRTPSSGIPVIHVDDGSGKPKYVFCHAISTIEEL